MGKLFGTDGIRGVANRDLTPEMAFCIGRIAAGLLRERENEPLILIGRDTRLSGDMLEGSLTAGIASTGVSVRLLGIISTPGVAYLTRRLGAAAGIVISASHNPVEDNGLKIFNRRGLKLDDALEEKIERYYFSGEDLFPRATGAAVGRVFDDRTAMDCYLESLRENAPSLAGMRLVADCGHGAACSYAPSLLQSLGAEVIALHAEPDGSRINVACGATGTGKLQQEVVRRGACLGLAFDGDADRLIAVDEKGAVLDGDAIMSVCAIAMLQGGRLKKKTLVTTVMSNGGLEMLAQQYGFTVVRTAVGDRFVLEKILSGGYNLGGEQSGHIIFADRASTGDGMLTALELLRVLREEERPLSALAARLNRLPQVLVNRRVAGAGAWQSNVAAVAAVEETRDKLGRHGRILVRPSGTEPLLRVMLEALRPEGELRRLAESLADQIVSELGAAQPVSSAGH